MWGRLFFGPSIVVAVLGAALLGSLVVDAAENENPAEAVELATDPPAETPEQQELRLFRTIKSIEAEQGEVTRELVAPLFEMGSLYASTERCPDAIAVLNRAFEVSRQVDGVLNREQLELLKPLLDCYLALDLQVDFERALRHAVLVNEASFGKKDPRMLPALLRAGLWYEQAGQYESARQSYARAIKIVEKDDSSQEKGKDADLRLVEPLRGIARAYRLEHQFQATDWPLDRRGERALLRAVEILRAQSEAPTESTQSGSVPSEVDNSDRKQRIETLLDLGDWYQMVDARREALRVYQEVCELQNSSFHQPVPILYRAQGGVALRRPPPDRARYQHYSVDLEFTVTREGRVADVVITESNAPKYLQANAAENLERTRFRPRFENGLPVDTPGMHHRQGVYARK